MIHFSKINHICSKKDKNGDPVPFSLMFVKKSTGEIVTIDRCICTSSFHQGTMNVKILSSGQIRKIIIPLVIQINNTTVYL